MYNLAYRYMVSYIVTGCFTDGRLCIKIQHAVHMDGYVWLRESHVHMNNMFWYFDGQVHSWSDYGYT